MVGAKAEGAAMSRNAFVVTLQQSSFKYSYVVLAVALSPCASDLLQLLTCRRAFAGLHHVAL